MDAAFLVPAAWYDGRSALRHHGAAEWDGAGELVLRSGTGALVTLDMAQLRFAEQRRDDTIFHRADEPDFRLILTGALPPGLADRLPARQTYGAWIDRIGLGRAAAGFAFVSAGALALFLTAPAWLGPMVPQSWERQLGDAMVGDLGNRVCATPESERALARLVDRVDPARHKVRVGIANADMVNAAALPGGQVLLFDGLVQEAETPDELAGVLAHEVGHVRERHVMTALLRQFGLSVLTSGFNTNLGAGGVAALNIGYSRDAEREADAWSRKSLAQSGISPAGIARFFERQAAEHGEDPAALKWLSSHPEQKERARAFRTAVQPGKAYTPALSPAEFAALKTACRQDRDVEAFDIF